MEWTPDSWAAKAATTLYPDTEALAVAKAKLASLPPLVTSWEVERLRELIAEAQDGKRLWLQGGDCAESLVDCTSDIVTSKLKILLQMSLVLLDATKKPVIRVGRLAGQYAKPRSNPFETVKGSDGTPVELHSYQGDLVNRHEANAAARRPDPMRLVEGYHHAAMTLNFVRSLVHGGFADPHHPENWELGDRAQELATELRNAYGRARESLRRVLDLAAALDVRDAALTGVEFFISHEGLNLHYEEAQTRRVPRRQGYYDLTTHFPWIGERTRALDGPHIEYFRGIVNPVGVKLGPKATADEVLRLIEVLNPSNAAGKIVLIARIGASKVREVLPGWVRAIEHAKKRVLWVCDPMHANTRGTAAGIKTRDVGDVVSEVSASIAVHRELGSVFGGVHVELTGENVTECVGGAMGLADDDLTRNYATLCDPRLNYAQSIELAVSMARALTAAE